MKIKKKCPVCYRTFAAWPDQKFCSKNCKEIHFIAVYKKPCPRCNRMMYCKSTVCRRCFCTISPGVLDKIVGFLERNVSVKEIATYFDCARSTIYRAIDQLKKEKRL